MKLIQEYFVFSAVLDLIGLVVLVILLIYLHLQKRKD